MVSEVLRLKEAAARESSEGSAYQLATAAHAEAVAMRSRVVEIDELARRSEWHATLEHSTWLCSEYPQHATLRALRVDALLALKRYEDATLPSCYTRVLCSFTYVRAVRPRGHGYLRRYPISRRIQFMQSPTIYIRV